MVLIETKPGARNKTERPPGEMDSRLHRCELLTQGSTLWENDIGTLEEGESYESS